jgi:hypothetical protein
VPFEFGNDFCTPCEPIARVWHKGNDPIGRRPIAVVDVVDVDLPEIHAISLLRGYLSCSTHDISCIQRAAANGNVMSICKNVCSAHSEWSRMGVRDQDEEGKERSPGNPHASTCMDFSDSPSTSPSPSSFSFLSGLPSLTLWHAGSLWNLRGSQGDGIRLPLLSWVVLHTFKLTAHFPCTSSYSSELAAKISQAFPGNEGAECTRWTQKLQMTIR